MSGNRRSIRLKDYDYTQQGAYYVTVCVLNHARRGTACRALKMNHNIFGHVENGEMVLNEYGKIIIKYWNNIPKHFPHVELDEYVVMPNHMHGIIITHKGTACRAPTTEQFGNPVSGSLPTIIRSFKSAVTRKINTIRNIPGLRLWQRNFYEHVIRDISSLASIREYVINNPVNWEKDEYYS